MTSIPLEIKKTKNETQVDMTISPSMMEMDY